MAVIRRFVIGHQVDAADSDETIIAKPGRDERVGFLGALATVASGLTSQTVVLKDGTNVFARLDVPSGGTDDVGLNEPLPLSGDLVVQSTDTNVEITVWSRDVA